MTDQVIITPVINSLTVTEDVNQVVVSSVGVQGATGPKGDTGDTGAQGASGVVTVNAPLTNAGTSSAANLSISAGTTSAVGALQLTDSVSSTSTTTAATPNAVRTVNNKLDTIYIPFVSGNYYRGVGVTTNASALAAVNTTYYTPFFVPQTTTFDRIVVRTGLTFSGTASVRLGIYNSSSSGLPSTVVLDAGTVSATASAATYLITINQQLTAGIYWLAANSQTAATTNTYLGIVNNNATVYVGQPFSFFGALGTVQYYSEASISGAFATAGTLTAGVSSAGISTFLRAT